MDVKRAALLRRLRAQYGFDVAVARQDGERFEDDDHLFESLVVLHLNKQLVENINEFISMVEADETMIYAAMRMMAEQLGQLCGRHDPTVSKAVSAKLVETFLKTYKEERYGPDKT